MEFRHAKDKKAKGLLLKQQQRLKEARDRVEQAKILHTTEHGYLEAEGLERTWKITQDEILDQVPLANTNKLLDVKLESGPYVLEYSKTGQCLLIAGARGHFASFEWQRGKLFCEVQVGERIHDIAWLHNQSLFAVAQSKHVYIYDSSGLEIHVLRKHIQATLLDFLPYHLLLVSVGKTGMLRYHDISTGVPVAELNTNLGHTMALGQNPSNAIMHLGHSGGTVTLWSPNSSSFLAKILCHRGPVNSLALSRDGKYMVTAGLDAQVKIWDVRTYRVLDSYFSPLAATSVDISQLGQVSIAHGAKVTIWKDVFKTKQESPYMSHAFPGTNVCRTRFCPFDDVLGVAHSKGVSTILVPGAGDPVFDSFEANPFETRKQARETQVRALLEKLPSDSIYLDSDYMGTVKTPKQMSDPQKTVHKPKQDRPWHPLNRFG